MQINKDNLAKYNVGLTLEEATKVEKEILKREPTVTELVAFGIEGSEHSSYKSSRKYLKLLPTQAPNVILGPCEDSGIIRIAPDWGIVISHESHNHPSQIVPYEGAATGIGGIVRDVICMGAKVIATADGLRFGDINNNHTKWIHERVVAGISGYGNPIGVANIGGDLYYNDSFNDNCLVNVVSMGVVRESEVIHSYAPKNAEGYNFILLGKPTDNSGFGGASFASFELDESKKEQNKGAVQEPNAFLKRHLFESTYDLFKILKEKNLLSKVGFKDLGAGGILCASVELADAAGYGGEVDVDKIHIGMENLDPSVILCSETQERFMWVADDETTELILKHYNEKWDLPKVSHGARASAIGKVKKGNYQVKYQGKVILDARAEDITRGLHYDREIKEIKKDLKEPEIRINDFNKILLAVLAHENVACRKSVYEKYDKQVQGITIIESGQADAGVMAPLIDEGLKVGMAFSLDGNPRHGRISPFWQGANAVIEAMRNVAAVGAIPWALTDCLNYGNPEKPEQMWQFVEGVKGVAEAAKNVHLKEFPEAPTPIISGNVSFYNQSKNQSIDPSANVACLGKIDDYHNAITFDLKEKKSALYLVGPRKNELGASVFYNLFDELGANVPHPDFKEAEKEIFALTDSIEQKLIFSAHDISDGGLVVTLAEMSFGGRAEKEMGLEVDLGKVPLSSDLSSEALAKEEALLCPPKLLAEDGAKEETKDDLSIQQKLFSETGGFVIEVAKQNEEKVKNIFKTRGLEIYKIGQTRKDNKFIIKDKNDKIINLPVKKMAEAWFNGLRSRFV